MISRPTPMPRARQKQAAHAARQATRTSRNGTRYVVWCDPEGLHWYAPDWWRPEAAGWLSENPAGDQR